MGSAIHLTIVKGATISGFSSFPFIYLFYYYFSPLELPSVIYKENINKFKAVVVAFFFPPSDARLK